MISIIRSACHASLLVAALGSVAAAQPVGVQFNADSLQRIGRRGDNWCMTWCADDSLIVSMDDGNWLKGKTSFSNRLYRIQGGPDNFSRHELPAYPQYKFNENGWFGYGMLSVDGVLYSCVSKCPKNSWSGPFRGFKLLTSRDQGNSWYRVDSQGNQKLIGPSDEARNDATPGEMFFWEQGGRDGHGQTAFPFSYCDFVQCARDNSAAQDDYIYVYSPEGSAAEQLLLARVPRSQLTVRSQWQFFAGWNDTTPTWTDELNDREPVHRFPKANAQGEHFGWYSWLPSVVWNPGLGLYIMVNGGTYAGHHLTDQADDYYDRWMHTQSGSLGFWYAEKPWGPWKRFYYEDQWTVDSPMNRTYQPKLSPKWISDDGKKMVLIWSDAMADAQGRSHRTNYRWNQMQITILTPP